MVNKSNKHIEKVIKEYYRLLIKNGYPVEKIILFGSFAKNNHHENSDIDLAVVLKKYLNDKFDTRLELMKFTREFEEVIEPHPFLASDFNDSDPFASEILKTGRIIFS